MKICAVMVIVGVAITVVLFMILFLSAGFVFPHNRTPFNSALDHFVDIGNAAIRYRLAGVENHPVIIMLHSFGSTLEMWEYVARRIGCGRVYSIDIVGFGSSVGGPMARYDLRHQGVFLIRMMDHLGIASAVLAGSSMGASLAAWTAAHYPDRISAIFVAAPSGYPGSMHHHWPMDYVYRPGKINDALTIIVRTSLFRLLFPNSLALQALEVTASYDERFIDTLTSIRQPMTILWSRSDGRVPFVYSEKYRNLCPHAKFVEGNPAAGHSVAVSNPKLTARLICDLVTQTKNAGVPSVRHASN